MRNLKKILALVLALVMVVGMMSIATAATPGTGYADDAKISDFDEAVQVLTALGIYQGDEKNNFRADATITRGEVAALVYRIVHNDVTDKYTSIYADYNKFSDVKASDWNAGYINYCANGEYILGNGRGQFLPGANVNGYQVLAIMLRALGYDKEGEFQGAGWEVRTARKAKELGITTNVTEGTLGAPATRALVAELIYRSIAQASTVEYVKLIGYVKTGATLGFETFGLRGTEEVPEAQDASVNVGALNKGDFFAYDTDAYEAMTDRGEAGPDAKYGEPIAYWYASSLKSTANPTGKFSIRFNPVKTYTGGLNAHTLYTLLQPVYDPYFANYYFGITHAYVDGEEHASSAAAYNDTTLFAGKGAVADVFVVEGESYVVVKNTYADFVSKAYNAKVNTALALTAEDAADIDYPSAAYYKVHAGIAKNSLVIFNKYQNNIDYTTIHTASNKVVTLTNSYVSDAADNDYTNNNASYFLVGKTKYEYDANYSLTALAPELLDREALLAAEEETQVVWFDDYGYVIFAAPAGAAPVTGHILVTNTTYGGYSNDNGYYMNIKGYGMDGKSVTLKGGFEQFVYGSKKDTQDVASDYEGLIGIYEYVVDAETGLVSLTACEGVVESDESIMASDPDSAELGDYLLTSDTVFVIAKYNKSGLITGYDVEKGIKDIKDLTDAKIDAITGASNYEYGVYAVDVANDDGLIDFVFVTGAKQTADKSYKSQLKDLDDVFFLLDTTPEKQFAEYDLYPAVLNGKFTYIKVAANAIDFENVGFFTIVATEGDDDYITEIDAIDYAAIAHVTDDIFTYTGGEDLWEYVSCGHDYIVLADDAKIINVLTTAEVKAADLAIDPELGYNALRWNYVLGVAAEYNQYGEVTMLYVIGGYQA